MFHTKYFSQEHFSKIRPYLCTDVFVILDSQVDIFCLTQDNISFYHPGTAISGFPLNDALRAVNAIRAWRLEVHAHRHQVPPQLFPQTKSHRALQPPIHAFVFSMR